MEVTCFVPFHDTKTGATSDARRSAIRRSNGGKNREKGNSL